MFCLSLCTMHPKHWVQRHSYDAAYNYSAYSKSISGSAMHNIRNIIPFRIAHLSCFVRYTSMIRDITTE